MNLNKPSELALLDIDRWRFIYSGLRDEYASYCAFATRRIGTGSIDSARSVRESHRLRQAIVFWEFIGIEQEYVRTGGDRFGCDFVVDDGVKLPVRKSWSQLPLYRLERAMPEQFRRVQAGLAYAETAAQERSAALASRPQAKLSPKKSAKRRIKISWTGRERLRFSVKAVGKVCINRIQGSHCRIDLSISNSQAVPVQDLAAALSAVDQKGRHVAKVRGFLSAGRIAQGRSYRASATIFGTATSIRTIGELVVAPIRVTHAPVAILTEINLKGFKKIGQTIGRRIRFLSSECTSGSKVNRLTMAQISEYRRREEALRQLYEFLKDFEDRHYGFNQFGFLPNV